MLKEFPHQSTVPPMLTVAAPGSKQPDSDALLRLLVDRYGFTLTRTEASEVLGVDPDTLDRWRRHGEIRSIKVGSTVRFRADDILSMAQ